MDNGNVAAALLMKAFHFEKALMQEHFNEKYVESEKFPKATFKGKIENFEKIIIDHTPVNISLNGKLTIHGVTKEVTATGTLSQLDATHLTLHSTFQVAPEDFGIKIPGAVREKIAKQIAVTVKFDYTKI
jgi:polyisoprenoid-binding protein YceI